MPRYRNYDDYKLDNPYHDDPPEPDYEALMEEARYRHQLEIEEEMYETLKPKTNNDTTTDTHPTD